MYYATEVFKDSKTLQLSEGENAKSNTFMRAGSLTRLM